MQLHSEPSMARAMYILGQIGAIICHERGPCPQTNVLIGMASRPAEGFTIAVAEMNALCPPRRGHRRALLQWKHKEIRRLSRMLPDPLPTAASAQTQMPFWAGYCQYWEDMLNDHAERNIERPALRLIDTSRKRPDA
ncbi:hypothetical protein [Caballeronia ptereochthonis]|uniref:Uncharacterized protein n=1 Tax=Caballeronia ptereochthonis TaxID=1777144 RepID=A0A158E2U3_9BURK|nr:hypothetical protein [Caballeronia ptereochthonis]SAL01134.1 hypothetical protein AWB83_06349 [Caballeronia ptereochthonis]